MVPCILYACDVPLYMAVHMSPADSECGTVFEWLARRSYDLAVTGSISGGTSLPTCLSYADCWMINWPFDQMTFVHTPIHKNHI